jgi:methionyl-tRNA formyltransferase
MSLNVVLITQGLSRVVNPIYTSSCNLVGIIEDAPRHHSISLKNGLTSFLKNVYFSLQGKKTLKQFSKQNDIPYFFFRKNEEEKLKKWLLNLDVDVIIVYTMSKLLKPIIFELPKYGTINLHPSYLPEYPGRNPWFWTYVNTDLNPGVTLHYIDRGEDTGDIIYQEKYQIKLGMESPEMQDIAIGDIGVKLIIKAIEELSKKGELPRKKQDKSKVYPKAYQIDINKNIIDWDTWNIERIWHLLRGTQLWYNPIEQPKGIFTGQRWKVLHFEKVKIDNKPGQVIISGKEYFLTTKEGKVFLKPTFTIANFLRFIFKNDR